MIRLAQRLVAHPLFRGFIVATILLAGALAGVETSASLVATWGDWLTLLNRLVLVVFVAEMVLKLTAHAKEPRRYFADGWNLFDLFVVALCLLPVAGPFAAVLRLSRVFRLLRLIHALPKLQLLVGALLKSLSSMGYVSLLLGLMFYIYGVAGVHLFGRADPGDFGSLPAALFTLFRIVTLDNWADAFTRVSAAAPGIVVTFYFVSFIVLGTMIVLNLFIGIVMNSMAEMHREIEEAGSTSNSPAAELRAAEQELNALQTRLRSLRQALDAAPGNPSALPETATQPQERSRS